MPFIGPTQISWTANTEPDLAGYFLYAGHASGVYTEPGSPVNVGLVTTYVYNIATTGDWYFALSAYDASGNVSGFSNEIFGTFDAVPVVVTATETVGPRPPSGVGRVIYRLNHR